MNKLLSCLTIAAIAMVSFTSCEEDSTEETEIPVVSKTIEFTQTTTSTSITLSWAPVAGTSWFQVYYAKNGETLKSDENFQNNVENPITFTINNLSPSTFYDIKIEGTDYLIGGKVVAKSKMITVLTKK